MKTENLNRLIICYFLFVKKESRELLRKYEVV